jgi:glycosyltransferase involved in cell wall biosynthesis
VTVKVAINAGVLRRGRSGTATVIEMMREGLELAGCEVSMLTPSGRPRRTRVGRLLYSLRWDLWGAARATDAGIIIHPANVGLARRHQKSFLVMHDVMVLEHPECFDRGYRIYARLFFGLSGRHASILVTPSKFSADRIARRYKNMHAELLPWPATNQAVVSSAHRSRAHPREVLMIGVTEPHKRHFWGVLALAKAREATGEDFRLRIIGPPGRAEDDLAQHIARADPDGRWIIREGEVSAERKEALLSSAWLLIQPSLDEGYGLPLLEAAAAGLPVLHTGTGAMSEVYPAGAKANSWADLSRGIEDLLDESQYDALQVSGFRAAADASMEAFCLRLKDCLSTVGG